MPIIMKTSTLIGAVVFLGTISYNSNSIAHPPDGYGIPEKYRDLAKPQTETVVKPNEPGQDSSDKQQHVAKPSKECQTLMESMNQKTDNDSMWRFRKQNKSKAKEMEAKINICKTNMEDISSIEK